MVRLIRKPKHAYPWRPKQLWQYSMQWKAKQVSIGRTLREWRQEALDVYNELTNK